MNFSLMFKWIEVAVLGFEVVTVVVVVIVAVAVVTVVVVVVGVVAVVVEIGTSKGNL